MKKMTFLPFIVLVLMATVGFTAETFRLWDGPAPGEVVKAAPEPHG